MVMVKFKMGAAGLAVVLGLALMVPGAATAEGPPKLAKAVYLIASEVCACTIRHYKESEGAVQKAFASVPPGVLVRIDLSKNMMEGETYIRKYKVDITKLPSLLLLDAQGNLLWKTEGGLMKGDEIAAKVKEFGM
jgi:hypothetical protein